MVRAIYDRHADVLYIADDSFVPAYSEEDERGILWRFALENDVPCGVTVLGFRELWSGDESRLARKIGIFLRVNPAEVTEAITSAVSRETAA